LNGRQKKQKQLPSGKDWSECTQEFLEQKYEEMSKKKYRLEKLYFKYWQDKIKICQQEIRQSRANCK